MTSGAGRVRSFSYYAIGNIARNLAGIALLPLYTAYLGPAEYGALDILMALTLAFSIIFGMDLASGIFRHYCMVDTDAERKDIIGTAVVLSFGVNMVAMLLLMAFSGFLANHFVGPGPNAFLLCVISTVLVTEGLGAISVTKLRADGKAQIFLAVSLAKLLLQIALNIWLVVGLGYGLKGMIYGSAISSAVFGFGLLPIALKFSGLRFSWPVARQLVRFGLPLSAAYIASFYLSFGDRFFISRYEGIAAVGIYALAWKIAQAQSLLVAQPFQQMWDAERYKIVKGENAKQVFQQVFRLFAIALIATGLGLCIFAPEALSLLSDHRFSEAADIVPILALSFMLAGIADYCRFGSLYASNTVNVTFGAWISALIITAGFIVLIPLFGVYGAAWAAVIGKAFQLVWDYKRAQSSYDMELRFWPVIRVFGFAVVSYFVARYLLQPLKYDFVFKLAFVAALVVGFWRSSYLELEEKRFFLSLLSRLRRSV